MDLIFALALIFQAPDEGAIDRARLAGEIVVEDAQTCIEELRVLARSGDRCGAWLEAHLDFALTWDEVAVYLEEGGRSTRELRSFMSFAEEVDQAAQPVLARMRYLAGSDDPS